MRLWTFAAACRRPREVQDALLRSILAYHADTAFGRDHHFREIHSVTDFRRCLPVAPYEYFEPYLARVSRGHAYYSKRDRDRAIADWTEAIQINPKDATAYAGRGTAYGSQGDYQQAIDLHKELDYPLLEAATWDSLGYAHHQLGDHAESAACYQRALGLYREIGDRWGQAETLGHVGDAHHAAGHPDDARAAWQEALTILEDLDHPDAGQIRAKLTGLAATART